MDALKPELDLDEFDRRLVELAPPAEVPVVLPLDDDDTVPLGGQATFQVWRFAPHATDSVFHEVLQDGALGRRASLALWMTRGGETLAPCLAVCSGLIPGGQFCALLDGRWTEHAWIENVTYCSPQTPGVDFVHGQGKQGGEVPPLTAPPSSENEPQMNSRAK
jgi:hypothetical protein